MKPHQFRHKCFAAFAIIILEIFSGVSSFGQGDPLNSWTQVWSRNGLLQNVSSIAYGNGVFVGVGDGARLVSNDGVNWTTYSSPPIIKGTPGVAFGGGTFVTFGTNTQTKANCILKSTDGITWTNIYTSSNTLKAAAFGNNTWVFVATNEIVVATMTSSNWNWADFQPSFAPRTITYGGGNFAVIGQSGYAGINFDVLSSSDGITWQYDSTFSFDTIYPGYGNVSFNVSGIAFGNGVFVASVIQYGYMGSSPYLTLSEAFVSSNLLVWNPCWNSSVSPQGIVPQAIAYGGGQFVGSFLGNILTSTDGLSWTNRFGDFVNSFAFGQGTFVAANYAIFQSGLFAAVSNSLPANLAISTYAGVTINGMAGSTYQIQATSNLNSPWFTFTNILLPYSPYLWIDTSSTVGGQKFYRSVQLQ